MEIKNGLTILQAAAKQAIEKGWRPNGLDIHAVDFVLDPPSIVLHAQPVHDLDNNDIYLGEFFPIFENDFAIAFWGKTLTGDAFTGTLPAWMYHQHRLLFILQWNAPEEFYTYINTYL